MNNKTESMQNHWDTAYEKEINQVGWYEEKATPSLELIKKCSLPKDALILNVGAGTTTLVDDLIKEGYTNLIVSDISANALGLLKNRLGKHQDKVQFVVDDLMHSNLANTIKSVDLWHDRAVVHFFTTGAEQQTYFDLLRSKVKKGGYAILATFHLEGGAEKCCALPVFRYNQVLLQEKLGNEFEPIEVFDYEFINPSGQPRKYIYSLWKRG